MWSALYPIIHLLPGISEMSLDVTAQHRKVRMAMRGMANAVGMSGFMGSPLTKYAAIGARKKRCMRYMPNDSLERPVTRRGACCCPMLVKSRNAPKVASRTFGVQNSHDHSSDGVSMSCPGTPFHQNDHPVNMAPMMLILF